MNWRSRIVTNPDIMFGKPTIKGTRITVELIVEKLANGRSVEQLMVSYPHLTADDIYACIHYVSESVKNK